MRFDGFGHMLSWWAKKTPDTPALRYEEQTVSFGRLYEDVKRRSADLSESGRTCLGILTDGSLDCVEEIFAASLAGLQIVLLDPMLPESTLIELMRYTDVDRLWGEEELCEELSPALTQGVTDGRGKILFFTSGTTEQAKAVVLTDHSLCQSAWNGSQMLPLKPSDTLLCLLPLGHVFGFVCGLLWGLSCGACVALGRGVRHYLDDCTYYRPTAVSVVPMLLGFLLQHRCFNPELQLVLVGAGDCPDALLAAAGAAGLRVSFGYGLTETSSGVAISVTGDPRAMEICPDDTITLAEDGEILIQAPTCLMQGYYKRPEDTAAALQDGVLHTGDIGRFDEEGKLHITGRKKDILVLTDGTKIFLPEYEAEIAGLLGTGELAVTLRDGKPVLVLVSGEQETSLGAGAAHEAEASHEAEKEILKRLLPATSKRPRSQQLSGVEFRKDALPRTRTGKIMRWMI